jgi:hypothetical protein
VSVENILSVSSRCPVCREPQIFHIRFQYGPCGYDYEIGDEIEWKREGVVYSDRPHDGNSVIDGYTSCKNAWDLRWLRDIGAVDEKGHGTGAVAPGVNWPPEGHELPSLAQRKEFGCPMAMNVMLIVACDRIERIEWPRREGDLVLREY